MEQQALCRFCLSSQRSRCVFRALGCFIRERFSLKVTVPLTLVLFGAPAGLVGLGWRRMVAGLITIFLALLILRIIDDISDRQVDMSVSPERGLASGKIDLSSLKKSAFLCGSFVLFLNSSLAAFLTVVSVAVCYFVFYTFKQKIPYVLQPLFVNIIFPVIPVYAGMLNGGKMGMSLVLLAIFIWTAVIAHDYAHSIHGPSEGIEGIQSFSGSLGSGRSAALAVLVFLCSSFSGFLFWYQSDLGLLFPGALVCTSLFITANCVKLLKNPVKATARKFYISGFVYFLVPLIAVIAETTFKTMEL